MPLIPTPRKPEYVLVVCDVESKAPERPVRYVRPNGLSMYGLNVDWTNTVELAARFPNWHAAAAELHFHKFLLSAKTCYPAPVVF